MTHRRTLVALLAAALHLLTATSPAMAQELPKKITIVVGFAAGGAADNAARIVGKKLGDNLGATVVIDNKAGAGGVIGTDNVAKSPADGHSLVLVDVFHTSTPIYTRKMPYDAVKDFSPVALLGRSPAFWVASPAFEPKTAQDVLRYAKANPGKLSMAIAGTGSVVVDLFKARSGVSFTSVPYRGSSPALIDVMSGQVNVMITTMASAGAHVKSGKLRVLAVTGDKRHADFPDVPTFTEAGVPGIEYEQWFGLLGPANLPAAVVERLSTAVAQVQQQPEVREKLAALAMEPVAPGPEAMRRQLVNDSARWVALAKELDIKPLD